jgi:hypothetical protein
MNEDDFEVTAGDSMNLVIDLPDDVSTATAVVWRASTQPNGPAIIEKTLGAGVSVGEAPDIDKITVRIEPGDIPEPNLLAPWLFHAVHVTVGSDSWTAKRGRFLVHPSIKEPQ